MAGQTEEWRRYVTYGKQRYGVKFVKTDIEISNFGNVRGIWRHNPAEITIKKGRRCLGNTPIYRLVWKLFNGPVPKGFDIHHIDFNKLNDRLDNLILLTRSKHREIHMLNVSVETREKISNKLKGHPGWHPTEEWKQIMSALMTGHVDSEETKKKKSDSHKGKYYNNGIVCKIIKDGDSIPEGFVLGKLKRNSDY